MLNKIVFASLFILISSIASADVLLIDEVRERMLRDLPSNGLSQAEVVERYGAPLERRSPVGNPPITRWVYEDYSVFFEYDLVLESVLHHGAVLQDSATPENG